MSTEQNKTHMRAIPEQIFNEGNLEAIDRLFATDYIEHVPIIPGLPSGVAGLKIFVTALRSAFSDLHYTVEDLIAEGDMVVCRATVHGTQTGEFLTTPASGKSATWSEIHIGRFSGGKMVEHWAIQDQLGMLQQLGVIPAMG